MSHYSRLLKVVIDAPPDLHDQELAFWQGALGQELPGIYSAQSQRRDIHVSGAEAGEGLAPGPPAPLTPSALAAPSAP